MGNSTNCKIKQKIQAFDFMASRVQINPQYLRVMPLLKLQSRAVTATILAYIDYKHNVILLVLGLSHKARAYLHNAGALKGFLKEDHVLKTILSEGGFNAVLKY